MKILQFLLMGVYFVCSLAIPSRNHLIVRRRWTWSTARHTSSITRRHTSERLEGNAVMIDIMYVVSKMSSGRAHFAGVVSLSRARIFRWISSSISRGSSIPATEPKRRMVAVNMRIKLSSWCSWILAYRARYLLRNLRCSSVSSSTWESVCESGEWCDMIHLPRRFPPKLFRVARNRRRSRIQIVTDGSGSP